MKKKAGSVFVVSPFGDHFSEHDLRVLASEPTGPLPEDFETWADREDARQIGQQAIKTLGIR